MFLDVFKMQGEYQLIPKITDNNNIMLVTDSHGQLSLSEPSDDNDHQWEFIPVDDAEQSYQIVSKKYDLAIHYDPIQGEDLKAIPSNNSTTVWYVNKDNEIYTDPQDKRYIWELAGNLYVTVDDYVCMAWNFVPLDKSVMKMTKEEKTDYFPWVVGGLIILILFCIFMMK
jgi:hypothetical protein